MSEVADLDTRVKLHVYRTIAETTQPPTSHEAGKALGVTAEEVEASFESLHRQRLLVPLPGDTSQILIAPPFSGVPTSFRVRVGRRTYFANCVWDSLGIAAALHQDALIQAEDGFSHDPMVLEVRSGRPIPNRCAIHFAVPAARWWDDIVFT
jgi:hypothetical protein